MENITTKFNIIPFIILLCFIFIMLISAISYLTPSHFSSKENSWDEAKDGYFVRLPKASEPHAQTLNLQPKRILKYPTFLWLELDENDFITLMRSDVSFTYHEDAVRVRVMDYDFDPIKQNKPDIPNNMQMVTDKATFYLIQFAGPTQDKWLDMLNLPVLQYYPHHTFLVWASSKELSAVEKPHLLNFIRWHGIFHAAYKIPHSLQERQGHIQNIDILFYNDGNVEETLRTIEKLGGHVIQYYPAQPDKTFFNAIVSLEADILNDIAHVETVLSMGYVSPQPVSDDEMSNQIVAGNYTNHVPNHGYYEWLNKIDVDGSGVIWSITDTGIDYNHPNLSNHIIGGYTYPGCNTVNLGEDIGGHGTHVAGIVGGDTTFQLIDDMGFLYGLGMAPGVSLFAQNPMCNQDVDWPPLGGWQELSKQGILGGAVGANNSWSSGEATPHGYQTTERIHDFMVRDGNFDTPTIAEPYIMVFSAGNKGPMTRTITPPKEAKNIIVVGGTESYRGGGDFDMIMSQSSRGPTVDGRYGLTVMAPGKWIASTRNDLGGDCASPIANTDNLYAFCSGTSMAAAHISGAVALIVEWWRKTHDGMNPSPAMVKGLLVSGNTSPTPPLQMVGARGGVPNYHDGWGLFDLSNVIASEVSMVYHDQMHVFDDSGEEWTLQVGVLNPDEPFKVMLVWSDAPAAVGANPALVNNLDLIVEMDDATYFGNNFQTKPGASNLGLTLQDSWSVDGSHVDNLNNVESVYLHPDVLRQNQTRKVFKNRSCVEYGSCRDVTIRVQASNISGDGVPLHGDNTDQDFALVCYNCSTKPDFTLQVLPDKQSVCAWHGANYDIEIGAILGYTNTVSLHVEGQPYGSTPIFHANHVPPAKTTLAITNLNMISGSYAIDVIGQSLTNSHTATTYLDVYNAMPDIISLIAPSNQAINQAQVPLFTWQAMPTIQLLHSLQVITYQLEIATDADFTNIVYEVTNLTKPIHQIAQPLDPQTIYYWRVRGYNPCGTGEYSMPHKFTTEVAEGACPLGSTTTVLFEDGFEIEKYSWFKGGMRNTWQITTTRAYSGQQAYHAKDADMISDQWLDSIPVYLPANNVALSLQFWQYYLMENDNSDRQCFDGALLEIASAQNPDSSSYWTPISDALLNMPYNASISEFNGNPLAGRQAWCGDTGKWVKTVVDLKPYAGQTTRFRFRLGTDNSNGHEGWYIDNVMVKMCQAVALRESVMSHPTHDSSSQRRGEYPSSSPLPFKGEGLGWGSCPITKTLTIQPGGDVTYCYQLTNNNPNPITYTTHHADDNKFGVIYSDTHILLPGNSIIVTKTATLTQSGKLMNTVAWTASNEAMPFSQVVVEDTATVIVKNPTVALTQTVSLAEHNNRVHTSVGSRGSHGMVVLPGQAVTHYYRLKNTDSLTLSAIRLSDSKLDDIPMPHVHHLAPNATYLVTRTAIYTKSSYFSSTAILTASDIYSNMVTTTSTAIITIEKPKLHFSKTIGTYLSACGKTNSVLVSEKRIIHHCYTLHNSGNITLTHFQLMDSDVGNIPVDIAQLAPNMTTSIILTTTLSSNQKLLTNTAIMTASDIYGNQVVMFDVMTMTLLSAIIKLRQTIGTQSSCAETDRLSVVLDTPVTYCYQLINTGEVTLTVHNLDDSHFGEILTNYVYTMPAKSSLLITKTVPATFGVIGTIFYGTFTFSQTRKNVTTWQAIIGASNLGLTVAPIEATDATTLTISLASISLSKTVGIGERCVSDDLLRVRLGTEIRYCYEVLNTGFLPLTHHWLIDSEQGVILNRFPYTLHVGAKLSISETIKVRHDITSTALWIASTKDGSVMATATTKVIGLPHKIYLAIIRREGILPEEKPSSPSRQMHVYL